MPLIPTILPDIMEKKPVIYADCAAQARPRPEAVAAAEAALRLYGNPSGVHRCAKNGARLIFDARKKVAAAINAQPAEIYFVSSATEANNTAILSAARWGAEQRRLRMLVFAGEHHAVLNAADNASKLTGTSVELVPCRTDGTVDLEAFERMCAEDVCLCALMTVNNETGVIQPSADFGRIARRNGALFLADAAQAVGHLPVDVSAMGCDFLSMSSHKFGGIPGAGALFCRNGLSLSPLICGGGQEGGRRSGTQALPAICAMGAAVSASVSSMDSESAQVKAVRDLLEQRLTAHPDILAVGSQSVRVPSILCVCLRKTDGEAMSLHLDLQGICVSSGAACTTGGDGASHVLAAMGIPPEYIRGSLRFSFDSLNTAEEAERIASAVIALLDSGVAALR